MFKKLIEKVIFSSKWLLITFYLGLFAVMLVYTYVYIGEIINLIRESRGLTKDIVLLSTLELVDIVMIANLVKMIITGSYNSFVSKTHGYSGENVSSGMLKVKMSTSLIGVSSIHLLQTFINASNVQWNDILKQLAIHGTFVLGALVLAIIDWLHAKSEQIHPTDNHSHEPLINKHTTPVHIDNSEIEMVNNIAQAFKTKHQ